jgi:PAT family beta-lactamase induction signal transducer AmpG
MSFSSGLPLGLVYVAIPDWMRSIGVDIKVVGLITLASGALVVQGAVGAAARPLRAAVPRTPAWMGGDRSARALRHHARSGRRRRAPGLAMGDRGVGARDRFRAATQDIAVDAYAVDVLRPDEQGVAVGFRTAAYLMAMRLAGAFAITLAAWWSWRTVLVLIAFSYLALMVGTSLAPKPEETEEPPRSLRDAVWQPFVGFLSRPLALEILAFVVLYKLSDVMANALLRPFLHDMGYNQVDRGVILGLVTWASTALGALLGGILTTGLGVGRSLWVFGIVQSLSNIGYIVVALSPVNRPLMARGDGFETLTSGMGTGAFSVLLLRLTQKRFSATQYSLMSSLFALPRIVSGPIAGNRRRRGRVGGLFLVRRSGGDTRTALAAALRPVGGARSRTSRLTSAMRAFRSHRGCF